MKAFLMVFIGGGLGSMLRYGITLLTPQSLFPWATFTANVLSSLILGGLMGWLMANGTFDSRWRLLWVVGFCGGFSTFSTFSYESLVLLQNQQFSALAFNIVLSVIVCVFCIFLGMKLVSLL